VVNELELNFTVLIKLLYIKTNSFCSIYTISR